MKKIEVIFILFFLSTLFFPVEATVCIGFILFLFLKNKNNIFRFTWKILWPIIIILIIGLVIGYGDFKSRNYWRDIFSMIKIILFFIFGFIAAVRYKFDYSRVFKYLSYAAVFTAILHLFKVALFYNSVTLDNLRHDAGVGNFLEALYLGFSFARILNKKFNRLFLPFTNFQKWSNIVVAISIVLYFSRTLIISFLIIALFIYLKVNVRKLSSRNNFKFLGSLIMLVTMVVGIISIFPNTTKKSYLNTLIDKFENIPSELFWTHKQNITANRADINSNWRGFEAYQGINKFNNGNISQKIVGFGWGALVDLGIEMKLAGREYEMIPRLHNGYVMLLIKVGISGLLLYFLFLFRLGFSNEVYQSEHQFYSQLILSILCIMTLLNTITISGLLNPRDIYYPFLLGFWWGQTKFYKINNKYA